MTQWKRNNNKEQTVSQSFLTVLHGGVGKNCYRCCTENLYYSYIKQKITRINKIPQHCLPNNILGGHKFFITMVNTWLLCLNRLCSCNNGTVLKQIISILQQSCRQLLYNPARWKCVLHGNLRAPVVICPDQVIYLGTLDLEIMSQSSLSIF